MFDSTPDIPHTDKMSQVIWYVHIEDTEITVVESVIDFLQLNRKSANEITKQIFDKLQADKNCYGQEYHDAATMTGLLNDVQKHILNVNPEALFVPCYNHSLFLPMYIQLVLKQSL